MRLLRPNLRRVHLTTGATAGAHRTATRHEHVGVLADGETVIVDGVEVTSLERTAVENPGESWCRAQMIEAGLPIPRLQHEFVDGDGNVIARVDFDWDGMLVGEFDGLAKYQKHLRPGETPFDAMRREKEREDALRGRGIMVIRWTWADLERGLVASTVREWLTRLRLTAA